MLDVGHFVEERVREKAARASKRLEELAGAGVLCPCVLLVTVLHPTLEVRGDTRRDLGGQTKVKLSGTGKSGQKCDTRQRRGTQRDGIWVHKLGSR